MRSGPTADFVEDDRFPRDAPAQKRLSGKRCAERGPDHVLARVRRSFFFLSRVYYYNIVAFLLFYFMLRCLLYYYK